MRPTTSTSRLLSQAFLNEVRADDRVLDMGTGSGVNAILATTAAEVVADDMDLAPAVGCWSSSAPPATSTTCAPKPPPRASRSTPSPPPPTPATPGPSSTPPSA
nr:50S ribosomal protein L11 methyltransferase [Actinokineospora inagensis]